MLASSPRCMLPAPESTNNNKHSLYTRCSAPAMNFAQPSADSATARFTPPRPSAKLRDAPRFEAGISRIKLVNGLVSFKLFA